MSIGIEKELNNTTDAQANPSGNVHYQSTISELKVPMPKKSGSLHMLKMFSMRRSVGTHPLRVDVMDEKPPNDMISSSKSISNRSLIVTKRETSRIVSSSGNSHNMKNKGKILK